MSNHGRPERWASTNPIGVLASALIGFAPTYFLARGLDEDALRMLLLGMYILLFISYALGFLFWKSILVSRLAGWFAAAFAASCLAIVIVLPYQEGIILLMIIGVALLFLEMVIGSVYLSWRVRHIRSNQTASEQNQSAQ